MVLDLGPKTQDLEVLCVGAHPDDIEIGCGGTLLEIARRPGTRFHWIVLSGDEARAQEAEAGAALFLKDAPYDLTLGSFRDGFFPYEGGDMKNLFEGLKDRVSPDLVFTHFRDDRHQDHRLVSELTWNTFRDHMILEYEVPKYDGDLGRPNCYVALPEATALGKVQHLENAFPSQADKDWFDRDTFLGLMRLRGVEARSPSGYAEGFHSYKYRFAP
jgi:LmbE family N-acetylglucosaminyl deacetylase